MLYNRIRETLRDRPEITDFHLCVNDPVWGRCLGEMKILWDEPVDEGEFEDLVRRLLGADVKVDLRASGKKDKDFSASIDAVRVRGHLYLANGRRMNLQMRRLRDQIPKLADLGVPAAFMPQVMAGRGLILITGPTGSGKSTTLAACLDLINDRSCAHILTIEDPVEYVHTPKRSRVSTRQLGDDVGDYAEALRAAMREDPDVIMVGELRDHITAQAAMSAAATGHLVFATMHTVSAAHTVQRMCELFPGSEQSQARNNLANVLRCVLGQVLIRSADGKTMTLASELMINTAAVRQLILEGKIHQVEQVMRQGRSDGHLLMNNGLRDKVAAGLIDIEQALVATYDPDGLRKETGS